MKGKIEILAPAGGMDCLKAAVAAGADAVYVGGSMFGARAYANNFSEEELLEAIDYVHLHGRKLFMTVNTLLKEQELEEKLYAYLLPYYKRGLDAVIVQDVGVLRFVRKHFPDLPIHASTQMTITGIDGAKFMEEQGVQRVVTSRELSMKEVQQIAEHTNVEIESFVHGALCYCYSGQCLFSSFLGGRSGNRGQCAQPCRLLYQAQGEKKSQYLLSLKDICTLECIPEMDKAGIYSFKIEGRMKKPEYVAGVVAMYRKYVDLYLSGKKYAVEDKDKVLLMDLYNRGGFHTGYYYTRNGREMVSLDRPNHAGVPAVKVLKKQGNKVTAKALIPLSAQDVIELPVRKGKDKADVYTFKEEVPQGKEFMMSVFTDTSFQKGMVWNRTRNEKLIQSLHKTYVEGKIKEKIKGILILSSNDYATFKLWHGNIGVTIQGDLVQEAFNQPIDEERVIKQMKKTGNTEFEFEELDVQIQENVFLPMQSLNELRREGLESLQKKITEAYRRTESVLEEKGECETVGGKDRKKCIFTASAQTLEQLRILIVEPMIQRIYADCSAFPKLWKVSEDQKTVYEELIRETHENQKEIYFIMPYIFREQTRAQYEAAYESIFSAPWDGVLIRNYESFGFLKKHGYNKNILTDYNMYQFNSEAKAFWKEQDVDAFTAPLELTAKEMKRLDVSNGEVLVYGHLPMMVSAGCVQKTLGHCRNVPGMTTITDRYRKDFVVKHECDYCYNVIYNQVPLYLGDKMQEVYDIHPESCRLMFTTEDGAEMKKVLQDFEQKKTMEEGTFTRGHWKNGIK